MKGKLPPRPIATDAWVKNGVHPNAYLPVDKDEFYGSYASAGDGTQGTLKIGPFDVRERLSIGIPFMTGPDQRGLSIAIVNHKTRTPIAELYPKHTPFWSIWAVDISPGTAAKIDVIAKDDGAGWGQWLAIGYPVRIALP